MNKITSQELRRAMELLIFGTENCDEVIKGKSFANGIIQRYWMNKEELSSPTVALESVILTAVINAHEDIEVVIVGIPNTLYKTTILKKWYIQELLWKPEANLHRSLWRLLQNFMDLILHRKTEKQCCTLMI